jgi:HD-GYP domain-containing protein (c-di-GMP phosphodiesterase class II)
VGLGCVPGLGLFSRGSFVVDLSGYIDFSIEDIVDNTITDFELYLVVGEHLVLYSGVGYQWFRDELRSLLEEGRKSFLIRADDLQKAQIYRMLRRVPEIPQGMHPHDRIQTIDDIGARLTYCIFEGDLTESCVHRARDLAKGLVDCISEDPSCIKAIRGLADYDAYTYHHSVRVAAYTVAIGIGMGVNDERQLFDLAMGGVLHDVGKKHIPLNILNKQGALTPEEWELMRSHPRTGWMIVDRANLTHISKEIVLHHHEKRNGTGYPDGLKGNEILDEVQIASLADIFDALTSNRSYQQKRTRFEALAFIKSRLLGEEIHTDAFRALVGVLAG